MKRILFAVLAVLATSPAFAQDDIGEPGAASQLQINTQSGFAYLQYHGRVVITSGSGGRATSREYRWGGTSCGSRVLSDAQLDQLQRAHLAGMTITPISKPGQGQTRCLVGFITE